MVSFEITKLKSIFGNIERKYFLKSESIFISKLFQYFQFQKRYGETRLRKNTEYYNTAFCLKFKKNWVNFLHKRKSITLENYLTLLAPPLNICCHNTIMKSVN